MFTIFSVPTGVLATGLHSSQVSLIWFRYWLSRSSLLKRSRLGKLVCCTKYQRAARKVVLPTAGSPAIKMRCERPVLIAEPQDLGNGARRRHRSLGLRRQLAKEPSRAGVGLNPP